MAACPESVRSRSRLAAALFLAAAGAALLLAGCATAKGSLFSDTQKADAASAAPVVDAGSQTAPPSPPAEKPDKGLRIVTDPPGVAVIIGLEPAGVTPLLVEGLSPGSYRVMLHKAGFHTVVVWLDYDGSPLVYAATLTEITGFVRVDATPPDATVLLAGSRLSPEGARVRVGTYDVTVRAFGYEERTERVEVREDALTTLAVVLSRASFALSSLDATRRVFSPANYGSLGSTRISFRVTAPGSGTVRILSADGTEVARHELPAFDTWEQVVVWDGRDATGVPVADGTYRVLVRATGADGVAPPSLELALSVDAGAVIAYRSLLSGGAGTLYAPTPETLPAGSAQVSLLALAHAEIGPAPVAYRIPVALGLRVGLGPAEVDVEAGTYLSSAVDPGSVPLLASVSGRYALIRPRGAVGIGAAIGARATYQALSTDTLTNYSGLAVSAPLLLRIRPVSIVLTPELIGSWTRVSYADAPAAGFWMWGYCRAGIVVDAGPLVVGVSSALRLAPFSEGLAVSLPLPVGAEVHFTIPGTQIVLTLAAVAEIVDASSFYVMVGGGFGFLQ
jgi:hypothetical protein